MPPKGSAAEKVEHTERPKKEWARLSPAAEKVERTGQEICLSSEEFVRTNVKGKTKPREAFNGVG